MPNRLKNFTKIDPTLAPYNASGYVAATKTPSIIPLGSTFIPVLDSTGFKVGMRATLALMGLRTGNRPTHHHSYIVSVGEGFITIETQTITAPPIAESTVFTTGRVKTVGTNAPGNIINVSCTDSYQVGQGILISGAGAGGIDYVGQVFGIAPGVSITVVPATTTSVAANTNVQHDDTAAFQLAINDAAFNCLPVNPPNGIYEINGPFQGSYEGGAVLDMPKVRYFSAPLPGNGNWTPMQTVMITGNAPAQYNQNYLVYNCQPTVDGVILKTDKVGGNFIGGNHAGTGLGDFTNVKLWLKNLSLISYPNPNITMVNAKRCAVYAHEEVQFETWDSGLVLEPTNTNGRALILPADTNGANVYVGPCGIIGYYEGINIWEHVHIQNIRVEACKIALVTESGSGYGFTADNLEINGCPTGITARGGSRKMFITRLNVEHPGINPWDTGGYDIDDLNGWLQGRILYDTSTGSVTRRGCANISIENLAAPRMFVPGSAGSMQALNTYHDGPYPLPGTIMQTTGNVAFGGRMQCLWTNKLKRNLLAKGSDREDLNDVFFVNNNLASIAKSTTVFDSQGYPFWRLSSANDVSALNHRISFNISGLKASSPYTLFMEIGPSSAGETVGLFKATGGVGRYFDPSNGSQGALGVAPVSSVITSLGNGNYLIAATFTCNATEDFYLWMTQGTTGTFDGDGTEFIHVSYPWLVPGSYAQLVY